MSVLNVFKRNPVLFPLACLSTLVLVFISESTYQRSVGKLDTMAEMGVARSSVIAVGEAIRDAETGQRGYLLTGRKEHLQPYDAALQRITQSVRMADDYYGQDPANKERMAQLHALIDGKLSELAETIRLHDEGKEESAMQILLSDIGREKMEALRQLTSELVVRETANVANSRADVIRTLWLSRVGVSGLALLGLLAFYMYLRQTSRLARQREEQQHFMQLEHSRLESEVTQRTTQLTELASHLQTAREDERARLARNLHDELGALLTSAKLDAARIRSRLVGGSPEALERLTHLVSTLNSSIALGRRIIEDLRPSALSNLGLVPTLEILGRDFSTNSGIPVHCELSIVKLTPSAELVVYRLAQEATTNIGKYARARNVWIALAPRNGQVEVTVRDDGVGFDTEVRPRSAYGLVGMRYRVEAEGGSMTLHSSPGQGTTIVVRLPEAVPPAPAVPAQAAVSTTSSTPHAASAATGPKPA